MGKRFVFQRNVRSITSRFYAELGRIELGHFGLVGGGKVDSKWIARWCTVSLACESDYP